MRIYQSLLTYLLLFLSLSVVLKFFGIIHIPGSEIIGYALIFYGVSSVYLSIGKKRRYSLFAGTVFFLTGILLYIINNFLIFWNEGIFISSALFIPGIAFLMLFFDDHFKKKFFITSIVFIAAGLLAVTINGQLNVSSFFGTLIKITGYYWPVALVAAVIIILISFEERK